MKFKSWPISTDYDEQIRKLQAETGAVKVAADRLRWQTVRTTAEARGRRVDNRIAKLSAESEAFARLMRSPAEARRIRTDMENEETQRCELAARVARFHVEPKAQALDERFRALVDRMKRDVSLSFPDALDGLDAGAMLTFELLRETIRPDIAAAAPAELLARYRHAIQHKTPRGLIEAELIEQRIERGGLAAQDADLPFVSELLRYVADVQDLRLPLTELQGIAETAALALRAVTRADAVQVLPVNPAGDRAAAEAFEQEQTAFTAEAEAAGQ
jgi:hypothetical protein